MSMRNVNMRSKVLLVQEARLVIKKMGRSLLHQYLMDEILLRSYMNVAHYKGSHLDITYFRDPI